MWYVDWTPTTNWLSIAGLAAVMALAACGTGDQGLSSEVRELTVTDEEVVDYRGDRVLYLGQLPDDINVGEDQSFHAHERFVQAEMSHDGDYIAFTTTGAAHGAGWVYQIDSEQVTATIFQYGGRVSLGPWRPDSGYLVMESEPPSGARLIAIIDTSRLDQAFEQRSDSIRVPQHDSINPEQQRYQVIDWEEGLLHFLMAGESWVYDPEARDFER